MSTAVEERTTVEVSKDDVRALVMALMKSYVKPELQTVLKRLHEASR